MSNGTEAELKIRFPMVQGLFLALLGILLLWSAFDYGGRYLHVQAISQAFVALLALLYAQQLRQGQASSLLSYPLLRPALLFFLALAFSWIFSVNRLASLEQLLRWLSYLLLALLVYASVTHEQNREKLLNASVLLALACGVCVAIASWWMRSSGQTLSGTFYRTNDLAGYLLLLTPLALHQLLRSERWLYRVFYGSIFTVLALSLLLTNSRSSWLAGILGLCLVLWFNRQVFRQRFFQLALFVLLALGSLGLILSWHIVMPRLQSILTLSILQENGTLWRLELWQAAWRIFLTFPLAGAGPNSYGVIMPAFQSQPGYFSINPHNFYLQILAETGAVGTVAFAYWLFSLLRSSIRLSNPHSAGLLGGILASLLHIAADVDWSVSAIPLLFAVFVGLCLVPLNELEDTPLEPYLARALAGVLLFLGLIIALLPAMNYFSARAFSQGEQALNQAHVNPANYDIALRQFQRARQLAPWPSGRHAASLGKLAMARGDWSAAMGFTRQALQLDRYSSAYYKQASDIFLKQKQEKQALEMLLRRQALTPYRHPRFYTEIGDFYLTHLKDRELALNWYQKGAEVFNGKITRYELYVPSDRYEYFLLYLHKAQVEQKLKQVEAARASEKQAQKIIRAGRADLFVETGHGYPMAALMAYWKDWQAHHKTPDYRYDSVHPQSEIHNFNELDSLAVDKLRVLYATRDIVTAVIIYAIPDKNNPGRELLIQDQLQGDPGGWKITGRGRPGAAKRASQSTPQPDAAGAAAS